MASYTDEWTAEHWEGRARMADARRHAGIELDPVDLQALARYPRPAAILHAEVDPVGN